MGMLNGYTVHNLPVCQESSDQKESVDDSQMASHHQSKQQYLVILLG